MLLAPKRPRQQYPLEGGYYQFRGGEDDRDLGFRRKSIFGGEIDVSKFSREVRYSVPNQQGDIYTVVHKPVRSFGRLGRLGTKTVFVCRIIPKNHAPI